MKKLFFSAAVCAAMLCTGAASGQTINYRNGEPVVDTTPKGPAYSSSIQREKLSRGVVAINNGGDVSVGWRYLHTDPLGVTFDVYKKVARGKEVKLNDAPLANTTFFVDKGADVSKDNTYIVRIAGSKNIENGGQYVLTRARAEVPYLAIPMKPVDGDDDWRYAPSDSSVGDLDGDGEYEIVMLRANSGFDNAHLGLAAGTVLIEAYKLDGTFLWRMDLGWNIRPGAHYTQLSLQDFDGDGKAELAVKTAEGTKFADGTVIGDVNGDGKTEYVDRNSESNIYGKTLDGPEFLSIIEGATGKELARTDFISRGAPGEFGDTNGNRVDRFLGGTGYFDGRMPSILICRGYYAKSVVEVWDWREGKLTRRWRFDTSADNGKYRDLTGQGNHNLSVGDVDHDGKDEIIYGAMAIDDNGLPLYNTRLGHGDAMHLTDINIDRPGLELWQCHESSPNLAGSEMRDAMTGQLLWGIPSIDDVGRAMAADIDPRFRGAEVWTSSSPGVYTAEGKLITERKPSVNMGAWWDGGLNRFLLNGSGGGRNGGGSMYLEKWTGDGVERIQFPRGEEITANNGTKANPVIHADLMGDWREEVVVRTQDNKEVRVYMSDIPTEYRFHTLMSDIVYRNSVSTQNIAYNQPTQIGKYLGSDLGKFWPTRLMAVGERSTADGKSGTDEQGRPNGMNSRQKGMEAVSQKEIRANGDSYTFDARYDGYESVEWSIEGTSLKGNGRYFTVTPSQIGGKDKTVKVKVKAVTMGCVFEDEGTLTFTDAPITGRRR